MFVLRPIGRMIVRLLAIVLFVLIRGRKVIAATAAVLLVGYLALINVKSLPIPAGSLPSFLASGGTGATPTRDVRTTRAGGANLTTDAVPAVDSYIKGLTQFDAKLMWGALSDDAINQMKTRGGSVEALQAGLDDAKRRGGRYEDITMIGTYPLQNGGRYLFYVMSRRGFSGSDQLEQVYFVFTVNREGKITKIE
jgi:hypothetical protein